MILTTKHNIAIGYHSSLKIFLLILLDAIYYFSCSTYYISSHYVLFIIFIALHFYFIYPLLNASSISYWRITGSYYFHLNVFSSVLRTASIPNWAPRKKLLTERQSLLWSESSYVVKCSFPQEGIIYKYHILMH